MKQDLTSGINLENTAHPCVDVPCANGGTCVPKKDGYECDCPLGFDGQHCQKGKAHFNMCLMCRIAVSLEWICSENEFLLQGNNHYKVINLHNYLMAILT